MAHRVAACKEILCQKLDEYIKTHKHYHSEGWLCPHKGVIECHEKMDDIMEDVEQAHDMLHAAMSAAGYKGYEMTDKHKGPHDSLPPHVKMPNPTAY